MHFEASTTINTSPETVWKLITDAKKHLEWNPTLDRVEGSIGLGEKVTFYLKRNPSRGFPTTTTEMIPNRKMVAGDGMPLGLFKGVRTYTLTPKGDNQTEFHLKEEFSGLLLPLFKRGIPDMSDEFKEIVAGLKAHAEQVEA